MNFFMKTSFLILITSLLICSEAFSQQIDWNLGLDNFIDNTEFGGSDVKIPQTMAGVRVAPEIGFVWDTIHQIHIGADMLHEYGSPDAIDRVDPIAYYQFSQKGITFMMGAMPRLQITGTYPRIFFQDSILFYRPYINGGFVEYRKGQSYINAWLDWTGRQSETVHEAFYIGFSGRYNRGIFYIQNHSYIFHYAETLDPVVRVPLHENSLFLTSIGADFSRSTIFNRLEANAGWVLNLERSRGQTEWFSMNGFYMEARMEYRWFGLYNSFYIGDGLMYFYNDSWQ